jgi:hypothetical protein
VGSRGRLVRTTTVNYIYSGVVEELAGVMLARASVWLPCLLLIKSEEENNKKGKIT